MAITKVSNSVLKDLAVNTQNIVDDAVQTSKIVDNAVQTSKIADNAVQASKIADNTISYSKISNEFKTSSVISASDIDFSAAQVFTKTLTANTTFTFSNDSIGMVKDIILTGDFTVAFPAGVKIITGTYDGTVSNLIQIAVVGTGDYWLTISQEAV